MFYSNLNKILNYKFNLLKKMGNEKNQHVKDKNRIDWTIIEFEKIFKEKGSIAYL